LLQDEAESAGSGGADGPTSWTTPTANQTSENIQKSVHLHCAATPKDWQLQRPLFEKLVLKEPKS
jgi:hypothetical protein